MKVLLTIVFLLGIFLVACGGGSKPKPGEVQGATSVPTEIAVTPTLTSVPAPVVNGKTCPDDRTLAVGKTQEEAIVNQICFQNDKNWVFNKISVGEGDLFSYSVVVDWVGCSDCPHEYEGSGSLDRNQVTGYWEASGLKLSETQESLQVAQQRQLTAEAKTKEAKYSQIKVTKLDDNAQVALISRAAVAKLKIERPADSGVVLLLDLLEPNGKDFSCREMTKYDKEQVPYLIDNFDDPQNPDNVLFTCEPQDMQDILQSVGLDQPKVSLKVLAYRFMNGPQEWIKF